MQLTSIKHWDALNTCSTSNSIQLNGGFNICVASISQIHCSTSAVYFRTLIYKSATKTLMLSSLRNDGHVSCSYSTSDLHCFRRCSCFASLYQPFGKNKIKLPRFLLSGESVRTDKLVDTSRNYLRCRAGDLMKVASFMQGNLVETDKLSPSVRDGAMKVLDELGQRVTIGDVASRAGLKISEAEKAMQALAVDSGGFLEVSDEGDVLYVFPKDYRAKLDTKSFYIKLEPLLNRMKSILAYLIRASFGTALLASIVLVYSTIVVLLSSSRSGDDSQNNRNGGFSSSQRPYGSGFTFIVSPSDLFWYLDPYYFRRKKSSTTRLNFFESVFSFVFGDGNPNDGVEDIRWKLIGDEIAAKGGIVLAEELAPLLDPPPFEEGGKGDESYVLPVLLHFDGHPVVDNEGDILYVFPSLQRTSGNHVKNKKQTNERRSLIEKRWSFSKASYLEKMLAIGLGGLNLFGVLALGSLLKDLSVVGRYGGMVTFVSKIFPLLQVYTACFFAVPGVRWLLLQWKNIEIDRRNRVRLAWANNLDHPSTSLQEKLRAARRIAERKIIGKDSIIYTTEKGFADQDYDVREWEQKLKGRKA